ncbi:raqprd family integrative conjugative element protein [Allochromatium humboldtianum]|uniref:Raqprd family integrative conjugative element protein n=1 Tax=Allochromatium humboldtianum TaxID=504901 RepID=A0A850R6B2_9GAMM|nr:RAQPRD family integrative conjugative element protein [Allochromatium humboldtianum]NVZ09304.1 raqprd family integrative conjugative element protein [Allochromatium humboldtianum]
MTSISTTTAERCRVPGLLLVCLLVGPTPALAVDTASEHARLAALVRQLDLIDRLAEHAANTAPREHARYHFDYARLRNDLKRVRTGVQDFLVPQRAQPRDPVPLAGDYARREERKEPSP